MRRFLRRHRSAVLTGLTVLSLIGIVYIGVTGQTNRSERVVSDTYAGQAMGTAIKKTLYGETEDVLSDVSDEIDLCLRDFEQMISVRVEGSEVAKCNKNYAVGGQYPLSEEVIGYLKREMDIYESSGGAFSPCIRPLSDLWGIEDGKTQVPDAEQIARTLSYCNPDDLEIGNDYIIFRQEDMAIDFGATGKGIAGDKVKALLQESSLTGAVVSIGGTIVTYGNKGNDKEWHVGLQDPRGEDGDVFAVVDVDGGTIISTSGDYEKYFEQDGVRYHHIFDPATGYPADSGLMSVSVITEDGFLSDALSTACFVMGVEDGLPYAEEQGVEAVFVTTDGLVYTTDGIRDRVRMQKDTYELAD